MTRPIEDLVKDALAGEPLTPDEVCALACAYLRVNAEGRGLEALVAVLEGALKTKSGAG